jgi:hypothetical protein
MDENYGKKFKKKKRRNHKKSEELKFRKITKNITKMSYAHSGITKMVKEY